ncbi:xanthine dehydrogenase/oxidase-like [Lytechinus variegatus]|uniref:xanthine dehydrogenase/oxidase-like n=1 Tax=Lytechinus variegatus TaxID=7654 RepID=UPI001BB1B4CF|nr:xanthine dehydrogenase/oxidase-like [Lytechinus variegatus]XP_041455771.1 xanthine dehydrogenase/oxidase-like [Lytechinus variegatus]
MDKTDTLLFFCNGVKIEEDDVDPEMTLLTYLRTKLRLTGTKAACGQGGCGACTVMISSADPFTKQISHVAVTACLMPLCLVHGKAVTTVEGLGDVRNGLHAVQERLAKSHGTQCGFCTPGMVMSVYTLLRNNPKPNMDDVLTAIEGNLCRCTGYRQILDGFSTFCGDNCYCARKEEETRGKEGAQDVKVPSLTTKDHKGYDPTQEPIFPPDLLLDKDIFKRSLSFRNGQSHWILASSLEEVTRLKNKNPAAPFIVGNTIIGNIRRGGATFPMVISPSPRIQELTQIKASDLGVTIGCGVTMTQLSEELSALIRCLPEYQTRTFAAIINLLKQYASPQIRNMASLGGTISSFSRRGDLVPLLMICGATATLVQEGGEREVILDENFKKCSENSLKPSEIAKHVFIPYTLKNEFCYSYKINQRRRNCLATVNSCIFFVMDGGKANHVSTLTMMFGGESLLGPLRFNNRTLDQGLLQDVINTISTKLTHEVDDKESDLNSAEFKGCLMATCFIRSFVSLCQETGHSEILEQTTALGVPLNDASLLTSLSEGSFCSAQVFQPPPESQPDIDPVGRPLVNLSAFEQCSGEAVYTDDIPPIEGELCLVPVLSNRPHAKIISIDPSEALAVVGVVQFVSHTDVPGVNGQILDPTEEVFVSKTVQAVGQPIGGIVARDRQTATRAAKLVSVHYEDIQPAIMNIEDAIAHSSYFSPEPKVLTRGDVDTALDEAPHNLDGDFRIGSQDHCYMEPRACIAKPLERNGMELTVTTQAPNNIQMNIAHCLGIDANKVVCKLKRLGGAFGGKDGRHQFAMITAVSANKVRKPVRLCLSRLDDTIMRGFRSPFLAKYKVGFDDEGRIVALDVKLYCDSGWSQDLSPFILTRAMLHLDSAYSLKHCRISGYLCKTNNPSYTSMRGFGLPQATMTMEHVLSEVGLARNIPQLQVREINLKSDGEAMYEGQAPLNMAIIKNCWTKCLEQSKYEERLQEIERFNKSNRWKKQGIAIIPMIYGTGFSDWTPMNQGAALVNIYTDGSVLVHHGGVEMGQGLHTKIIQIASRVLSRPVEKIHTSDTSTDRVPNATVTSGSLGTELFGGAVKNACETLIERLKPFKDANPSGAWEQWVFAAYCAKVSLSATGFHRLEGMDWDWQTKKGNPYAYDTYGVGVSQVEIDCLTGEHSLLRTDLVLEIGKSINPALNIGQIEGGFIQAYGYFTMEQVKMSREGALLTQAPQTYKIPLASDIPPEFNVTLLREGLDNINTVYSSKAVGECSMVLAISVPFAIKHATTSVRQDLGMVGPFTLNSPATIEEIRMACGGSKLIKCERSSNDEE